MIRLFFAILGLVAGIVTAFSPARAETTVTLGFFEAGTHPGHDELHKEFGRQANFLIGPDTVILFHPDAYRNAGWSRDSSRALAKQYLQMDYIDAIVTMGPWVVEDLLAAGVTKPIIAMYRGDPIAEGLVDSTGRPITPNLTVQVKPGKMQSDLESLQSLVDADTIGFLYFPSGDESERVVEDMKAAAAQMGATLLYGSGTNNIGTYAFFNGLRELPQHLDALYVGPLWDMDATKQAQFFYELNLRKIPCMAYEGWIAARLGATFSDGGYSMYADARYNADKLVKIIRGVRPSLLPIEFYGASGMTINQTSVNACNLSLPQDLVAEAQVLDELINTSELVPLSFAIQQALAARPEVAATYDRLDAAAAAAKEAWSAYLPHASAEVLFDWRNDNGVDRTNPRLDNSGIGARLGVEQTIFSLEAIRSIQGASLAKERAEATNEQARLDLERSVALAYVNLARCQQIDSLYELYRRQIDLYYEFAATDKALERSNGAQALRLQSERQRSTRRLLAARADRAAALSLLTTLMNQPGRTDIQIDTGMFFPGSYVVDYRRFYPFVTSTKARQRLRDHVATLVRRNNPESQLTGISIETYRQRLAEAGASLWPTLSLFADLDFTDRYADNPDPFREENPAFTVGGRVNLPLLSGLKTRREKQRLRSAISAMEFTAEAELMDRSQQAVESVDALFAEMTALPSTESAVMQAAQYLGMTIENYQADSASLLELLDAQDQALVTAIESVENRYRMLADMIDILYACGWSVRDKSGRFTEEFFQLIKPARPDTP